jgi:hypothetical protein
VLEGKLVTVDHAGEKVVISVLGQHHVFPASSVVSIGQCFDCGSRPKRTMRTAKDFMSGAWLILRLMLGRDVGQLSP